jgi:hypothetical protein
MNNKAFLSVCFLLLSEICAFTQPYPIKYGKIDTAELKMKFYDLDTTAKALILCYFGNFDEQTFEFTGHYRLKVFKKEGAGFANQFINVPGKSSIRGCTYNWKDGKVVETRLKDESIYTEHVQDNLYRFRVSFPDVVDGSIIELIYTHPGIPREWRFQQLIPTKWSELRIPKSTYFSIRKTYFGFHPLYINEIERWVGKDMPAILTEPYMNSITNYMTHFDIELVDITIPRYINEFFSSSWEAVCLYLGKHDMFGMQIKDFGVYMAEEAREINNRNLNDIGKMKAARDLVKQRIKWNDYQTIFSAFSLPAAYHKESGNSADVNLSLIKLLKKLDFEVYPVVLSTRDHGMISPSFPTLSKLDHVIACVKLGDLNYLLDATEKNLPFDILPPKCINGLGRILYGEKSDWIDLAARKADRKIVYGKYSLDDQGIITGTLSKGLYDYASLEFRNEYEKFNSQQEYLANIETQSPGVTVNNLSLSNMDSVDLPVKAIFDISMSYGIEKIGDMIALNPFISEKISEMPFKEVTRKYPIDFIYPRDYRYVFSFTLPENYSVAEVPAPVNLVLPEKQGKFTYKVTVTDRNIQVNSTFEIANAVFAENKYELLREFYRHVIAKQNESIIIKKVVK